MNNVLRKLNSSNVEWRERECRQRDHRKQPGIVQIYFKRVGVKGEGIVDIPGCCQTFPHIPPHQGSHYSFLSLQGEDQDLSEPLLPMCVSNSSDALKRKKIGNH